MQKKIILAIDQGTTGTRAILYGASSKILSSSYQELTQYYPQPGWVEHDANEIWKVTLKVISAALRKARITSKLITTIGITNQRETVVLWNKKTGEAVLPAIVWQDRRTAALCLKIKKKRGMEKKIRAKTGLVVDPYFSASKLTWIFDRFPRIHRQAKRGDVLFGTIDTWLLWNLTGGKSHATDFTNASRTLLFNIRSRKWDPELLRIFKVPETILPKVKASGDDFGETIAQGPLKAGIPIQAMIGDQQAALYGQCCYRKGQVKNTYGTGCFIVMNTGKKIPKIPHGLLVTLAADEVGQPVYALEGSIFIGGAAVQWLRDGLHFFRSASETDRMIKPLTDSGGVTVIPAFVGLGSPYWNAEARGMISGITRGTTREHIIRATLESLAQQSADVIFEMTRDIKMTIHELRVDGGATSNAFLMQAQADLLQIRILVSSIQESTAWGAAKLAGRMAGIWTDLSRIDQKVKYKRYYPKISKSKACLSRNAWHREIKRLLSV